MICYYINTFTPKHQRQALAFALFLRRLQDKRSRRARAPGAPWPACLIPNPV